MIVHSTYSRLQEEIELIKKHKPQLVITSLGSPKHVVEIVHEYGGLVFSDVSDLKFARKAAETGVDGLILVQAVQAAMQDKLIASHLLTWSVLFGMALLCLQVQFQRVKGY